MNLSVTNVHRLMPLKRGRFGRLGAAMILLTTGQPMAPAKATDRFKDGEFVGRPAETEWGAVQVKIIIRDGSLRDVQFLQYPWHRRRSAEISNWVLPVLRSETMQHQDTRVDMISGATMTAEGFRETVASALNQAGR